MFLQPGHGFAVLSLPPPLRCVGMNEFKVRLACLAAGWAWICCGRCATSTAAWWRASLAAPAAAPQSRCSSGRALQAVGGPAAQRSSGAYLSRARVVMAAACPALRGEVGGWGSTTAGLCTWRTCWTGEGRVAGWVGGGYGCHLSKWGMYVWSEGCYVINVLGRCGALRHSCNLGVLTV